jgi:hypothetical protein
VSIAFRVWNDATPLSRSDSTNSIIIIIIICLLTPYHSPSSIYRIRCSSCLYPVSFDLDPRPFRRRRLASNVFACVYVCARARFLLFVDSVLSNSYRVMKGSSTRTRCHHCRFFFSSFSLHDVQHIQKPQERFLSLVRVCFILSLKTTIHSMCIIWCLNEIRISYTYMYMHNRCRTMIIVWVCACLLLFFLFLFLCSTIIKSHLTLDE